MILNLSLTLSLAFMALAEDKIRIINVSNGENVSLPCTAMRKDGVDYRACRWYKESDLHLTGLVSRSPLDGTLRWYVDADTRISLEYRSLNLLLPPVNCSHSGLYQCYLAAPVGEQNRQGRVRLSVKGCPIEFEKTPVVPEVNLNQRELVLLAAILGLFVLFVLLGVTLKCWFLTKAKWNKEKSVDRLLYPDLSYPLEKQGFILPNFTVEHCSKTSLPKFISA